LKRAVVWVVLLILMGWSTWRFMQPEIGSQTRTSLTVPDISKIAAIEFVSATGIHVHLKEKNGIWILAGSPDVPANTESVQHLLDDLTSMRVIRVVTHTHAHDDALGMNKGTKLTLLDHTEAALLTLTIGKQGSDLIST